MITNPVRTARDQGRREATLDAVAHLRATARAQHDTPGAAARRSALGQAANDLDHGVHGAFDREIDRAYRAGLDASSDSPVHTIIDVALLLAGCVMVAALLAGWFTG